jgi:hypothetical protein
VSGQELALLRLAAQRLVGPPLPGAAEAVRHLTAVQAQDFPGALLSVALRSAPRTRGAVAAALDAGEVVRSWPMRGTLHLVAAEDLLWMTRLLTPRVLSATAGRRRGLDLAEADVERGRELAVQALTGGGRLRRAELFALWEAAGIATAGQRGVHLVQVLAMTGTVVLGPTCGNGSEQHYVLCDEWIRSSRDLEGDEALAELALRYFRGHGPATVADLARWAQLPVTQARAGARLARPALEARTVDGTEYLLDPRTPEVLEAARARAIGVLLLPGFDEFVLGYGDRSAQLDPVHADRIVPGGNGVFRPTVVSAGRVVGTWTRRVRGTASRFEASAFTAFAPDVEAALPGLAAELP